METDQDRENLSELLDRCVSLCGEAERQLDTLSDSRFAFLTTSVTDALQQLELMLRIVEDEQEDSPQRQARQGLLKRLFQRGNEEETSGEEFQPPSFDVSQIGLHGNTTTIPITELLSFLAYGSKTGVLWLDSPEENFLVGMVEGQLRHANSDQTPPGLRLGEVLVHLGYLTERQLDRHLGRDSENGTVESVTGEALLESGIISDDELAAALSYQTRCLFQRMINTTNAVFRFREGMEVALAYQVALDINQLLLDHARVQDEAAYAQAQAIAAEAEALAEAGGIDEMLADVLTETVMIVDEAKETEAAENDEPRKKQNETEQSQESNADSNSEEHSSEEKAA